MNSFLETKLKLYLQGVEGKICCSIDGWADGCLKHFIGVVATFMVKKQIKEVTLGLIEVDKEDSETLLSLFTNLLNRFQIFNKFSAIICDNGKHYID